MRKQIAAANWKMNCTYQQAEKLLDDVLDAKINLAPHQDVVFTVPFPYLIMTNSEVADETNYFASAQNCYNKKSGAYTGEVSAEMLQSIGIRYCIVGHSERREYFQESNKMLAEKIDLCLEYEITPIFCCGEPLSIREVMEHLNANTLVSFQIETKKALEAREELLSVPGIDAVMIGPADLSISLGVPGDFQHPKMVEAMEAIRDSCVRHKVAPGTQTRTPALANFWKERGMLFLGCNNEAGMLLERATQIAKELNPA